MNAAAVTAIVLLLALSGFLWLLWWLQSKLTAEALKLADTAISRLAAATTGDVSSPPASDPLSPNPLEGWRNDGA